MGFLTYQFPNQEIHTFEGEWTAIPLSDLPNDVFFITDFTKEKTYYFKPTHPIEKIDSSQLTYHTKDDVFAVNTMYYCNGLRYFIDGFEENGIQKAIFSRIKLVDKENTDVLDVFSRLAKKYKSQALVYLVSDEKFGTWMGATPEILLSGDENKLHSMALAGTKSTNEDEWTEKEREEHQYVIDFIKERIEAQFPTELNIHPTETVSAGAVYHLQTNFDFKLEKNRWNSLIQNLHPTPAVCGTPSELAQEYILNLEPHDREFYTGIIGWRGSDKLQIYVNLRCMQVLENQYALYVGGGITKASNVEAEWIETENKSQTLLSVINQEL